MVLFSAWERAVAADCAAPRRSWDRAATEVGAASGRSWCGAATAEGATSRSWDGAVVEEQQRRGGVGIERKRSPSWRSTRGPSSFAGGGSGSERSGRRKR
jgi:hypothetical protein